MGADNWAICPKCVKIASDKYADAYGKVSEEKYLTLMKIVNDEMSMTTFREDYEIGVDESGIFYIRYSGHCNKCGLKHSHKSDKQLVF